MKTFSGKVVRHSLAYLAVHKWLVGDVPFYLNFWVKVTHPSKTAISNLYTVTHYIASAENVAKKVQLQSSINTSVPYDRTMFLVS